MIKNLDNEGLQSIAEDYDLFYIDLWGVIHNGIKLHEDAIFTLKNLLKINKDFVLLTNAPRPIKPVKEFLEKMGMDKKLRDKVFTSGAGGIFKPGIPIGEIDKKQSNLDINVSFFSDFSQLRFVKLRSFSPEEN